ncbi:MAG: D-amino acid aminotransferase [Bdellovibrio bacteriovorus]
MSEVYLNGDFVALEQATVSVLDRGFLFGDGVYEVIPSYGGHFLGLDPHLDRLEASLAAIGLLNPLSREQWHQLLLRLVGPPPAADQYVYLQITRGSPPERDHLCPEGVAPTVFAMARSIKPRGHQIASQGVTCITRPDPRWSRCEIKATSLLAAVLMRREAHAEDALETIMVRDGVVTEGSSTNVFVIAGDTIATPAKGHLILSGITRELVLSLAAGAGMRYVEGPVPAEALRSADEIWLSSSTREVLPVTRLDGQPVGQGVPGPLWRRMDGLYQDYKDRVRSGVV